MGSMAVIVETDRDEGQGERQHRRRCDPLNPPIETAVHRLRLLPSPDGGVELKNWHQNGECDEGDDGTHRDDDEGLEECRERA